MITEDMKAGTVVAVELDKSTGKLYIRTATQNDVVGVNVKEKE